MAEEKITTLEEAANAYLDNIFGKGKHEDFYVQLFIAGAEWQKEQILQLAKNRYEMAMTFVSGNLDVNQAIQLDRLALVTIIQKMDSK